MIQWILRSFLFISNFFFFFLSFSHLIFFVVITLRGRQTEVLWSVSMALFGALNILFVRCLRVGTLHCCLFVILYRCVAMCCVAPIPDYIHSIVCFHCFECLLKIVCYRCVYALCSLYTYAKVLRILILLWWNPLLLWTRKNIALDCATRASIHVKESHGKDIKRIHSIEML